MALGLVPEVLNPVDMIHVICEQFRVVDLDVMELGSVQNIMDTETVGIDDGVRSHLILDDWEKRVCTGIWDDYDMNLAPRFKSSKTGILPAAPRPRLPFLRLPK